jgi:hypothetical protein
MEQETGGQSTYCAAESHLLLYKSWDGWGARKEDRGSSTIIISECCPAAFDAWLSCRGATQSPLRQAAGGVGKEMDAELARHVGERIYT